jgi:cobalt/nickel transport protein
MTDQSSPASAPTRTRRFVFVVLAVALVIGGVISFYASGHPDGLEFVAETAGFLDSAQDSPAAGSPLAGYGIAGIENARLSGGLAAVIGVLVTLLAAGGLARLLRRHPGTRSGA